MAIDAPMFYNSCLEQKFYLRHFMQPLTALNTPYYVLYILLLLQFACHIQKEHTLCLLYHLKSNQQLYY